MSKRRGLDDDLYGDRADVRARRSSYGRYGDEWSDALGGGYKSNWSSASSFKRCYHTHPPLTLPGTDKVIYGGACGEPIVKDANIYIGFDRATMNYTARSWPWKKGHEFLFPIRDMSVPEKPDEFRKLVEWTKAQIDIGNRVHCGCIGGHGRTGLFLSALVSLYGEADAIAYVRKNYCVKAVESSEQVKFLEEHYGVKPVDGSKQSFKSKPTKTSSKAFSGSIVSYPPGSQKPKKNTLAVQTFNPIAGSKGIWGQ